MGEKKSFLDFIGDLTGTFVIGLMLMLALGGLGLIIIIIFIVYKFDLFKKISSINNRRRPPRRRPPRRRPPRRRPPRRKRRR